MSKTMSWAAAVVMAGGMAAAAAAETPLERGAYLMNSIVACGNCHTMQGPDGPVPGRELAGGPPIELPGIVAHPDNLTPDLETGIGRWSDAEIIRAMREGIRPDGSVIGPPMPLLYYRRISDRDAAALVAYLRSVPAVRNVVAKSRYDFPLPPAYGPPVGSVPETPRDDPVAYGAYLADIGHCLECHTPMVAGKMEPDFGRRGAGGLEIPGPWGVSISANITADRETGIGGWSDDEIKAAITKGKRPDGSGLAPPMPYGYYARMTQADLDALVAWVRTLAPVRNALR